MQKTERKARRRDSHAFTPFEVQLRCRVFSFEESPTTRALSPTGEWGLRALGGARGALRAGGDAGVTLDGDAQGGGVDWGCRRPPVYGPTVGDGGTGPCRYAAATSLCGCAYADFVGWVSKLDFSRDMRGSPRGGNEGPLAGGKEGGGGGGIPQS